jgi:hypothetical protein
VRKGSGKVTGIGGEILLYQPQRGSAALEVRLDQKTLWLSLNQMAALFDRDKSVISRHLRKVFHDRELERRSVVAKNATTAEDGKIYQVEHFNLDAILSVGYRVNSRRGTEFRIWATHVLKDHLLRGYTLNEQRLQAQNQRLIELQHAVDLMGRIAGGRMLAGSEAEGLLKVITDYSLALGLLDDFDHERLTIRDTTATARFSLSYEAARTAIDHMAARAGIPGGGLFGREKDASFKSALGAIYQTFDGRELYPSVEEKAAHLRTISLTLRSTLPI